MHRFLRLRPGVCVDTGLYTIQHRGVVQCATPLSSTSVGIAVHNRDHMRALDLRKVEVFYYVAKLRSFSKAAEALRLTQPTISGHIKTLEESLALVLFDRLGREGRLG